LSVARAGFLLTPLPLTIAVIAPFSGALADRFGSRWLAAGGLALARVRPHASWVRASAWRSPPPSSPVWGAHRPG